MEIKEGVFRGRIGKAIELATKAISETGEFEGYGAVFDTVDQGMDRIDRDAFTNSLTARPLAQVKMLWQHDTYKPIGAWTQLSTDDRGLKVTGKLFLGVQQGREAYELMREGAIDGLSMGYVTKRYEIDRESGIRKLLEVDLREVSIVTFPMHEEATISLIKADGKLPTEREFEDWLKRDAGFSAAHAKGIVANGYRSLKSARDAGEGDEGIAEAMRKLAQSLRS